jgi:parallel beta-helix repeat protein
MKVWQILFCCFGIVFSSFALDVSGVLTGDHIWKKEDSPVHLRGHIVIPAGSSLKINPGVQIFAEGYFHILVQGVLEAVGESEKTIVFTKSPDLSKNRWEGLILYGPECKAVLSDCVVEYAFKNLCWKTSPIIRSSTFRNNNYGLYCSNTQSMMILKSRFTENTYGIYCDFSSPTIQGNTVTKNDFGIYCIFSSAPLVGQNVLEGNTRENLFLDDSMGKNATTVRNQYIWSLVRGIF